MDIDTCTLHKVHGSFKVGVQCLPINIDQFAVDLHSFFKMSSARREDYKSLDEITNVTGQYALRHSSVRWLTLKYVLVRIVEQWSNLLGYFLKYEIKETKRYKNLIELLKDDLTLPYLAFSIFLAHEYEAFLLMFQT